MQQSPRYRKNLSGNAVVNEAMGSRVAFSARGAKTVTSGKGEDPLRIVPALREIVAEGTIIESSPDRRGRSEIMAIHKIGASVTLGGVTKDVVVTIRETPTGTFHYDLSRDISDGARFSRFGGFSAVTGEGDLAIVPALEGNPFLNLEFSTQESKVEAVPVGAMKSLAFDVQCEVAAMVRRAWCVGFWARLVCRFKGSNRPVSSRSIRPLPIRPA